MRPPCARCRKTYAEENSDPPCWDCIPELMEENVDPARIWQITCNQAIISGAGEIIDINHQSLWMAIDRLDVENPQLCFDRVRMLFRHFMID